MRFRALTTAAALMVGLVSSTANAQGLGSSFGGGFALQQFEPAPAGDRFFVVNDATVRPHLKPAAYIWGNYALKPLKLHDRSTDEDKGTITDTQLYVHLGGSIGLFDRALLSADIPFAVVQGGDNVGQGVKTPESGKLADIKLGLRVNIFGKPHAPAALGVGFDVWLPTGSKDDLASDGAVRLQPKLLFSGQADTLIYSANVGYLYRDIFRDLGSAEVGSAVTFAASAGYLMLDKKLQVGPELYGNTVITKNGSDSPAFGTHSTPLELLLGAKLRLGDFVVGGGIGPGLTKAPGTPIIRAVLGGSWVPESEPKKDIDGDGITDDQDACPTKPGKPNSDPKKHGCPEEAAPPPGDSDGDGIPDPQDHCPTVPGVPDPDPQKNGCPADRDQDGILDKDDACPDVFGIPSENKEFHGCPDTDKDGVFDKVDACVNDPGKADVDPKKNGCPDRDNDGILDKEDACPDAPGKPDPDPKKNGCPLAAVIGTEIKIMEQVKFDTGRSTIRPESSELLKKVGEVIRENPTFQLIIIEGHTDNRGNKGANKVLSQQRADAVKKWLVDKEKIEAKRLNTKGWGDEKPIDSNDTDAGRQNNRRVEFHIDKKGDAPAPTPAPGPKAPPPPKAPAPKK